MLLKSEASGHHRLLSSTIMYDLYLCSYSNFFYRVFLIICPILYSYLFLVYSTVHCRPTSFRNLIPKCPFLFTILISSHKGRLFLFSFYIWSDIPIFSTSPLRTAFQYFWGLIFYCWHVSPLYTLLKLYEMEYSQFLVMLHSVRSLTRKRILPRVVPLLNIDMIYGPYNFWNFSAWLLTYGKQTVVFLDVVFC